jgi:hypothetical protein
MFSTSNVSIAVVKTNPNAYLMLKDSYKLEAVLCLSNSVILWSRGARRSLLNKTIMTIEVRTIIKAYNLILAEAIGSDLYIFKDISTYLALIDST